MRLINSFAFKNRLLEERDRLFPKTLQTTFAEAARHGMRIALRCMEQSQTIEAESVKHGEWLDTMCSNCQKVALLEELDGDIGRITVYAYSNYCPNCGAKMDGGNNNEDR